MTSINKGYKQQNYLGLVWPCGTNWVTMWQTLVIGEQTHQYSHSLQTRRFRGHTGHTDDQLRWVYNDTDLPPYHTRHWGSPEGRIDRLDTDSKTKKTSANCYCLNSSKTGQFEATSSECAVHLRRAPPWMMEEILQMSLEHISARAGIGVIMKESTHM